MSILEPASLYVCNVMGDLLYPLDDIDKASVSLQPLLNGQWELSFTYTRSIDDTSPAFDALEEGMYLFLSGYGQFKMRQPQVRSDAATDSKTIKAYSCDVEFEDHMLSFPVNMGTETSLEYLVKYNDGETELLLNPQYHTPYDWIVLYNTYPQQLTKLEHILEDWSDRNSPYTLYPTDEHFDYCVDLVNRIERLRSASVEVGERTEATFVVQDVTDEEMVKYTFEQYVTLTVNSSGETTAITFETTFPARLATVKTFYENYRNQLSLLDIICDEMGGSWQPGEIYGFDPNDVDGSDYSVANLRYQFDINEVAYSFLASTYAQRSKCVVNFDILRRKINVTPVEHIGSDTGIVLSYDQLLNTLNIQTNEDTLATRITVHGADGLRGEQLSIEQINFGEPYIVDLAYKMNARDKNGNRLYVTDALAEKYERYNAYRESVRDDYIDLARQYNKLQSDISEVKYRVPVFSQADNAQFNYDTMTEEELEGLLKTYTNALYTLQDLYAEDYGYTATPTGVDSTPWVDITTEVSYALNLPSWFTLTSESTMIPRIECIRETMYWWDYYNYRQTLTQIYAAMQARYDAGSLYKYSEIPETSELYDKIHAWETEWSLYGTVELQNKIDAYTAQLQTMIDGDAVIVVHATWNSLATRMYKEATDETVTNPFAAGWLEASGDTYVLTSDTTVVSGKQYYLSLQHCFRDLSGSEFDLACRVLQRRKTWDNLGEEDRKYFDGWAYSNDSYVALCNADIVTWEAIAWEDLTDAQKALYGGMSTGYYYTNYKKIYDLRDDAQLYLDDLLQDIADNEEQLATIQAQRTALAETARLDTYENPATGETFTDFERSVIYLLYRDAEYTNDYILASYTDDTVTILDTALKELYDDAVEQVRTFSRPQLTFTVESDNLLALDEFEAWRDQFKLGNYMYIEYRDGRAIRVRLVGYTFNPCIKTNNLSLQFSNLTYTKTKVSDVESVLGMAGATTSSGGGGSSGGGSGSLSALDDLGINLTDTMLRKLLTKESFNKEVSESVKEAMRQQASLSKVSLFRGLQTGATEVSGDCITTGTIKSEATASVTIWHIFEDLSNNIKQAFGVFAGTYYRQAIPILKRFADLYGARWNNLSATEKIDEIQWFFNNLSSYQKGLFGHSYNGAIQRQPIDVFSTMISYLWPASTSTAEALCYTTDVPVSELQLNNGAFNYCGGNLKYGYDGESIEYIPGWRVVEGYYNSSTNKFYIDATTQDETTEIVLKSTEAYYDIPTQKLYALQVGQLTEITGTYDTQTMGYYRGALYVHGNIDASKGTIAGVVFTEPDPDSEGYFEMQQNGFSMSTNSKKASFVMENDGVFLRFQDPAFLAEHHNNTGGVGISDDGISISKGDWNNDVHWRIDLIDGEIYATGQIRSGGGVSVTSYDCKLSGTADTSNSLSAELSGHTAQETSSGTHHYHLLKNGVNNTAAVTLSGPSGTAPSDTDNEDSKNKCIKAKYNDSTYAAIYSNGNIWATHCIRGASVYASTTRLAGADYAELFEWVDGNKNNEDRRGRFVTMDGEKIRFANADDAYILGVISANPSVVGDASFEEWSNKYLRDAFGAILYEPVECDAVLNEYGEIVEEAHIEYKPMINPDYDPDKKYVPREERQEWTAVGLVGKLVVVDDGTCEVNGFATSANDGIATKANGITNYRVIKRIDSNHIMVAAK